MTTATLDYKTAVHECDWIVGKRKGRRYRARCNSCLRWGEWVDAGAETDQLARDLSKVYSTLNRDTLRRAFALLRKRGVEVGHYSGLNKQGLHDLLGKMVAQEIIKVGSPAAGKQNPKQMEVHFYTEVDGVASLDATVHWDTGRSTTFRFVDEVNYDGIPVVLISFTGSAFTSHPITDLF